jgi:cysteine desulfurase/selenocysteine lyase
MMLDQQGIAVRTGHHCTMPLMDALGLTGTIRASLSFYNTKDEIDRLYQALVKAKSMLV